MLDVNLFRLIARERDIYLAELTCRQKILPIQLIEKIVDVVALAKKQPALTLGAGFSALFDKAAIRRNAGASANHDDRAVAILGEAEVPVWLDVDSRHVT